MNWRVTARRSFVETQEGKTYVIVAGMGGTVEGAVRLPPIGARGHALYERYGVRVVWDKVAVVDADEKSGSVAEFVAVDSPADVLEDRGSL